MTGEPEPFEQHRDHLLAVAYRMLGSRADAEDVVQETWLRWRAADQPEIRDLRAWLTTVTARICLDQLRSARLRREAYVGQWLPEPLVDRLASPDSDGPAADPADRAARTDRVGYALQVVLERLGPEQRVAFVLHDVFAVPFPEIASVLGTTPAAARQLASRARRAVRTGDAPRHTADPAEQRRVVTAFLAAAHTGDIDGLLAVLAPDAVTVGDGGGVAPATRRPVTGSVPVARFLAGLFRRYRHEAESLHVELVRINGDLGLFIDILLPDGDHLRGTLAFAISGGRITAIYSQVNPAKLARLPAPDPARAWTPSGTR
ncbi:MAG: sigma-70 family RNA polymerase sigma factor [Micromonosporaceae bacterium]|nr:sigma-70 family RNA polymerase sigma factor [Micromonosporaceae bacterium]